MSKAVDDLTRELLNTRSAAELAKQQPGAPGVQRGAPIRKYWVQSTYTDHKGQPVQLVQRRQPYGVIVAFEVWHGEGQKAFFTTEQEALAYIREGLMINTKGE